MTQPVLQWELATRQNPWDELGEDLPYTELFECLNSALQTGRRPTIPEHIDREHPGYVLCMRRCWSGDPNDRPSFAEVTSQLARYLRRVTSLGSPTHIAVDDGVSSDWTVVEPIN